MGPAGTGKTTTMRAVARAWETRHGRGSVLGLTLSVRARGRARRQHRHQRDHHRQAPRQRIRTAPGADR
ncbi:AAA family ATPase [Bifidobacterium longum]|uniref:AAA family ATPase n=1 Tax=Bifidobacterium longum TaxID=216816 RepID=UPI001F62475A|nr:AAA family ATPase [Bifidobacterium longum]